MKVPVILALIQAISLFTLQGEKSPVPTGEALRDAEKTIKQAFKEELAKSSREGKRALAEKLISQSSDSKNSLSQQYACLTLARDTAALALDLKTAFAAIDSLDARFQLERPPSSSISWIQTPYAHKAAALDAARKVAITDEDQTLIAEAYMGLAEAALASLQYEDAATAADQATKYTKIVGFLLRAKEIIRDVPLLKQELETVKKAEISLAVNPEDPVANGIRGRYLMFAKREVDKGLLCLSKSSDADLKDLASRELSKPATPEAAADLAEGWYALIGKAKGIDRKRYLERSLGWFDQSLQAAGGISRTKIDKRLTQIEQTLADSDPLVKGMTVDGLIGWWKFDEGYGDKVLDSSRLKNHGTRSGGAFWINGKYGGAVRCDGTSGQVVIPTSPYKSVTDSFTMALWVKPSGEAAYAIYPTQGQTAWGSAEDAGVGLQVGPAAATIVEHSSVYVRSDVGISMPIKDWTHVAVVYEKKVPKLYVAGKLVKTGAPSKKVVHPSASIGASGPFVPTFFAGQIDDFRIYGRSLTEQEIRGLAGVK